jgi:alpha-amylase
MYRVPNANTKLLLKNYKLSDDIAFRFTNGGGSLSPTTYASWIHELSGNADIVGLFLDYETFGEHHREESGILAFLKKLPEAILSNQEWRFSTPTEAAERLSAVGELSFSRLTSWADTRRDESAWLGNEMQRKSLGRIYDAATLFHGRYIQDEAMTAARETWRRLQTSDHYYYMCTKGYGDGIVHQYFSPFESPYDAFIAYSNVVKDFAAECARAPKTPTLRVLAEGPRVQP